MHSLHAARVHEHRGCGTYNFVGSIREVIYDAGELSEPPDSADGRQRSSVRRGAVAAARSNQWRETTGWNYWRGPYRQHHWRAVGQEWAQGIVFVAPPGGIEGSGGGARSAGPSRHGRTGDCLW